MTGIAYVDGPRLFRAFEAGAAKVFEGRELLNRINVFPVADGDTGNNLAATVTAVLEGTRVVDSVATTSRAMAAAALTGARGNAGLLFAQLLYGFSRGVESVARASAGCLPMAATGGLEAARAALTRPVEGTMLTVVRAWASCLHDLAEHAADFVELVPASTQAARTALERTPEQLEVLRRAGVVDSGAKGFVLFLEGVEELLLNGRARRSQSLQVVVPSVETHSLNELPSYRYCSEAVVAAPSTEVARIRTALQSLGDSLLVGGQDDRVKVHLHTNSPERMTEVLEQFGPVNRPKVDDMLRQVQAATVDPGAVAVVTDSACDLPFELIDRYRVHLVPIRLSFGESTFLDKMTLTADRFYSKLDHESSVPTTSQVPTGEFETLYRFLLERYESVVSIHLSSALSGTWNSARLAAERVGGPITVVDSRTLCVGLGLVVQRAAAAASAGADHAEVVSIAERSAAASTIMVGLQTLRYMVRGGRISRLKGLAARTLNLKPVITVDGEGKGQFLGRAHSQRGVLRQIEDRVAELVIGRERCQLAVVHAHAPEAAAAWAQRLSRRVGQEPEYIMDISPVIGLNSGVGSLAVGVVVDG